SRGLVSRRGSAPAATKELERQAQRTEEHPRPLLIRAVAAGEAVTDALDESVRGAVIAVFLELAIPMVLIERVRDGRLAPRPPALRRAAMFLEQIREVARAHVAHGPLAGALRRRRALVPHERMVDDAVAAARAERAQTQVRFVVVHEELLV